MKKIHNNNTIVLMAACMVFAACLSKALEDAPIITSATHQHTLYNGMGQSIEVNASKKSSPLPIITYFHSEEDLHVDRNGSSDLPVEVGDYYVRIRRPAGNGYKAGNDITVEFHIQKALVTISAEERQEFSYDGKPKSVIFTIDQNIDLSVVYYRDQNLDKSLKGTPAECGFYLAIISYTGDDHHMGASKSVELVIR